VSTRDDSRRFNDRREAPITQRCVLARNTERLQRLSGSRHERNVDDRIIRVYRSELSGVGDVTIDVVVMRRWAVLVGTVVHGGMHMQLGRLHVHKRESGNQRDREHPTTESRYHVALTIVLHRDSFRRLA